MYTRRRCTWRMVSGPISRYDGRKDLWLGRSGTPLQWEWWEFLVPLPLWWCPMGFFSPKPDTCLNAGDPSPSPPPTFRSCAAFTFMNARSSITTKLSIVATMNGNAWNINEGPYNTNLNIPIRFSKIKKKLLTHNHDSGSNDIIFMWENKNLRCRPCWRSENSIFCRRSKCRHICAYLRDRETTATILSRMRTPPRSRLRGTTSPPWLA